MPPTPPALAAADKAFMKAWDAEIDADEAQERQLGTQARADERAARSKDRDALAQVSGTLLRLAGLTQTQAQALADAEFARARKAGAAQRKRALVVLKTRVRASAAETKKLIAGMKRS